MEITPRYLASIIGGTVEGNQDIKLHGFGKLEEAGEGMLTFLANPKYNHLVYDTKASAILVSNDFMPEHPLTATLIRVADPYKSLAELMEMVEQMKPQPEGIEEPSWISADVEIPEKAYIGAFSYIAKGVTLGKGVKIYPQVYIGQGVEIGEGTVLRPGVKIYEGCKIGKNCILHGGVVIGADGFGFAPTEDGSYKKIPQTGIVVIGDNVEIGANSTIDRATFGETVVASGTKIDNLVQIGHNVRIGSNNVFCAQSGVAGSTKIGDNNRIGGQVGFAGHIAIGNNNDFGAQSGVHRDVADNNRLMGYPAVDWRTFARQAYYLKSAVKK